jgi:AAA15 family ATPase/GTPase
MNTGVSNHFDAIGLKYDFKKQKKKYHSELSLKTSQFDTQYDKNLLSVQYDKNYKETLQARFLSNDTLISFVHDRIDKIIRSKKKDELISELKKIDSKIIDISLSSNKIVYVDIGIDQMIPLNLMGDGFSKVCAIIANLLVLKDGYLIIDEIENGLHYESLSILWNAIISACKKFNVQIFLSTHSYEAITALLSVISTNNYNKEDFQFLLVQKFDDKQHKCYSYDVDNMLANIESEVEFRGKTLGK